MRTSNVTFNTSLPPCGLSTEVSNSKEDRTSIVALSTIESAAANYDLSTTRNHSPLLDRVAPFMTEEKKLGKLLDEWMNNPSAGGNKTEAIKRIKNAFEKKSTLLDLMHLNLTSIPEEIFSLLPALITLKLSDNKLTAFAFPPGSLPCLESLFLRSNQLTTLHIPADSLVSVAWIYIHENQLTTLTFSTDSLLSLKSIDLGNNKLTTLTFPKGSLPSLQSIDVHLNNLTEVVVEQGALRSLTHLSVHSNRNLASISIDQTNCPDLCYIDYKNTQIPPHIIEKLLSSSEALRDDPTSAPLATLLKLWCNYAGVDLNFLDSTLNLKDEEKKHIEHWLHQLTEIKDFQNRRKELAEEVCAILKDEPTEALKLVWKINYSPYAHKEPSGLFQSVENSMK